MIVLVRSPCNQVGHIAHAVAVAFEAVVVGPDVAQEAGDVLTALLIGLDSGGVPVIRPVGQAINGVALEGVEADDVVS